MKISSSPNECETSLKFTTLSTTKSDLEFQALVDGSAFCTTMKRSKSEEGSPMIFFWTLMTAIGVAIFTFGVRAISIYEEIEAREMIIEIEPFAHIEENRHDSFEIAEGTLEIEADDIDEEIINNNFELLGISQTAFVSTDKNDILEETFESEDFLQMEFGYLEDIRIDHIEENQYESTPMTIDEFEMRKSEDEIEISSSKTEITSDEVGLEDMSDTIETKKSKLELLELDESVSNININDLERIDDSPIVQEEKKSETEETKVDEIEIQPDSQQDNETMDGFKIATWKFYESEEDDEEDLMEQYALEGQSKMLLEAKAAGWAVT